MIVTAMSAELIGKAGKGITEEHRLDQPEAKSSPLVTTPTTFPSVGYGLDAASRMWERGRRKPEANPLRVSSGPRLHRSLAKAINGHLRNDET